MKRIIIGLAAGLGMAACTTDESVAAYGGADRVWTLETINGTPSDAVATLEFGRNGQVSGQAPCNRYTAQQTAPYPWFAVEAIGGTRMACPDLAAENAYFAALSEMSQSEVVGDVLRLNNDAGDEMIFRASPQSPS